jgi:CIC family chloride channel protein
MSGNYSIILPVILANTIAYLLSRSLQPVPIFEMFTHQDGLDLPSMEEQRENVGLHLEDALSPMRGALIGGKETLKAAAVEFSSHPELVAAVVQMSDGSCYALRAEEMAGLEGKTAPETTLEQALPKERVPILFPDLPLDTALRYFSRWPVLPVCNRATKGALEGIVTLEQVLARYQRA